MKYMDFRITGEGTNPLEISGIPIIKEEVIMNELEIKHKFDDIDNVIQFDIRNKISDLHAKIEAMSIQMGKVNEKIKAIEYIKILIEDRGLSPQTPLSKQK